MSLRRSMKLANMALLRGPPSRSPRGERGRRGCEEVRDGTLASFARLLSMFSKLLGHQTRISTTAQVLPVAGVCLESWQWHSDRGVPDSCLQRPREGAHPLGSCGKDQGPLASPERPQEQALQRAASRQ